MINVFTHGNKVSELFESKHTPSKYLFNYDTNTAPQDAISLTMPIIHEPYEYWHGLHPIFEMNLPEDLAAGRCHFF